MLVVSYETAADALDADRALYDRPCGVGCLRQHYVVYTEPGRLVVLRGTHDPSPTPGTLAQQLARYYPRYTRNGHKLRAIDPQGRTPRPRSDTPTTPPVTQTSHVPSEKSSMSRAFNWLPAVSPVVSPIQLQLVVLANTAQLPTLASVT